MSRNSGVTGKTVFQLARSQAAAERQQRRALRSAEEQLVLLLLRQGVSARERKRLSGVAS